MDVERLLPDADSVGEVMNDSHIWRINRSACSEMLKVEVCVIKKRVSTCFVNLSKMILLALRGSTH